MNNYNNTTNNKKQNIKKLINNYYKSFKNQKLIINKKIKIIMIHKFLKMKN